MLPSLEVLAQSGGTCSGVSPSPVQSHELYSSVVVIPAPCSVAQSRWVDGGSWKVQAYSRSTGSEWLPTFVIHSRPLIGSGEGFVVNVGLASPPGRPLVETGALMAGLVGAGVTLSGASEVLPRYIRGYSDSIMCGSMP